MILLVNTFITNARLSHYHRGLLPPEDRLRVFEYTLASLASIPWWSTILLYVKLDTEFCDRWGELEAFVGQTFPAHAQLFPYRMEYQRQWQTLLATKVFVEDDPLIWYLGNDDHLFLDYDLENLARGLHYLLLDPSPYASLYYSHWPENYRIAHNPRLTACPEILDDGYLRFQWACRDAIQVVKREVLEAWWFGEDYGDLFLPRTDWQHLHRAGPVLTVYAPPRELCRHFDGYTHIGLDINQAPPLAIPPGFFEQAIRVRYGAPEVALDCVDMNPLRAAYKTVDPQGTDYKWVLEDIPLFWKSRLGAVETYDIDPIHAVDARNNALQALATAWSHHPDVDNQYLPTEAWLRHAYRKPPSLSHQAVGIKKHPTAL